MSKTTYAAFAAALAVIALALFRAEIDSMGGVLLVSVFQVYLLTLSFEIFRVIWGNAESMGSPIAASIPASSSVSRLSPGG